MRFAAVTLKDSFGFVKEKAAIGQAVKIFGQVAPKPPFGPGDDCAVVDYKTLKDKALITSDCVIAGRHFDMDSNPFLVGEKIIKRNISDIAAMGGIPLYAQTSAVVCDNMSMKYLRAFLRGMASAAKEYNVKIIGGDLASVKSNFFSMHLALIGRTETRAMLRSGAKDGDYICVSGALGASYESKRHLTFRPKVPEGRFLAACKCVVSCMDISDGIASDLKHLLCKGLCAELFAEQIPVYKFKGNTLKKALCDGEDYELLFCVRGKSSLAKLKADFHKKFGAEIYEIGRLKKAPRYEFSEGLVLVENNKKRLFAEHGFEH